MLSTEEGGSPLAALFKVHPVTAESGASGESPKYAGFVLQL